MSSQPKEIIFDEDARLHLLDGIKQLSELVAFTIGPRGRNVGVEKSWGSPAITNDGSTILKDVSSSNQFKNMGISMGKEVAQKMKETCGDGSTRATLLLGAMVESGVKMIAAGASPIDLKRGMDKAIDAMIKEIEKTATPVQSEREIVSIATVAASNNEQVGKMIADAMQKVGKNGVITIEEAKSIDTTLELVEGMRFDRGYLSAYFSTNGEKMIAEYENPYFLLIDKKVSSIHEILPVLQVVATSGQALVIIAEDFDNDTLSTLVVNRLRAGLKVVAVKSPGFGDRRKAMLQDIAVLTGAEVISDDTGTSPEMTSDVLGSADKVLINKEHTTIIGGKGEQVEIQSRIKQIEAEISTTTSSYDKEKLEERKAKLAGSIAVIKVGAITETEQKHLKQLYEDSLNSTKAANENGIVAGGGVSFINAAKALANLKLEGDEAIGAKIVQTACDAPLRQIVSNSGKDGQVILAEVKKAASNIGYNAISEKIEDMIKADIVDPAKVIIEALRLSTSVAGIVLISEALIGDVEDEDNK